MRRVCRSAPPIDTVEVVPSTSCRRIRSSLEHPSAARHAAPASRPRSARTACSRADGSATPVRFTRPRRLGAVAPHHPVWRTHLPAALLGLALVALAIAVARPQLRRLATRRARDGDPRRRPLPLDGGAGRPALAPGGREGGGRRVPRARPARLQVGIVTFSGDVTFVASPTLGPRAARALGRHDRPALGGYGGTAIGDALARAVELGRDAVRERGLAAVGSSPAPANVEGGRSTILFLSDGRQNRGILPPPRARGSRPRRGSPSTPSRSALRPAAAGPAAAAASASATARRIPQRCG